MKINFLNSVVLSGKWRFGMALLAMLVAIWCALTPGAAQSRNHRRLTSIQIGEVSEGSRVTIGSDSALNDYEAFRRGDRFYVRIPLADFTAGKPAFRGDGFEDVQVQKVGDSIVVSFKLQPGATARVDQRSNRLDIIFSGPNRTARSNRTTGDSNRGAYIPTDGIVRLRNPQTLQRRDAYAAGPIPPGSPQVTRERVTRNGQPATNLRQSTGRVKNRPAGNSGATDSEPSSSGSRRETSSRVPRSTPHLNTSKSEPSPTVLPSTSPGYPALTSSSTPAVPVASQPAVKSPALGVSQNGKPWSDIARQWVSAHRPASLLGALALLCVLVFLAVLLLRRRKNVVTANRSGATLGQPKPAIGVESDGPSADNSLTSDKMSSELVNKDAALSGQNKPTPVAVPNLAANVQPPSRVQENAERGRLVPEKAMARTAVAAPQNHAWVPTNRSTGSSADEDQEREVFEL